MIGIIGAMDTEVARLKELMTEVEIVKASSMEFYKGILHGADAVVVRAGVGKVNAACCTQALLDRWPVSCVINTGIAGSLRAEIDIGDIVLASDAVEHDMDVSALGYPPGKIPDMDAASFAADETLRRIAKESCEKVNPDIHVYEGRVVTGDQFISSKEKKAWLVETFGGFCAEMEGAAIAHTAYLNGTPFLIVRAISDKADDSAKMDYPTFEAKAIEHSVRLIEEMAGRLASWKK
ncbi:5'-methylthioadenosine/S-adenosylhomocysteine nucleosidase [Lachnospiraceae bacterium]|jgi:adenosylhomocysteine nucleosidase|nr:5'-methylthioadenosine/adenosylhomocysteine nucleosidase [Eubacterium sp.]GFI27073.1 5'-methylthioadenosine/S-adenosylhomocysteine nucleosidase [Lachnospiraceae bacterium]